MSFLPKSSGDRIVKILHNDEVYKIDVIMLLKNKGKVNETLMISKKQLDEVEENYVTEIAQNSVTCGSHHSKTRVEIFCEWPTSEIKYTFYIDPVYVAENHVYPEKDKFGKSLKRWANIEVHDDKVRKAVVDIMSRYYTHIKQIAKNSVAITIGTEETYELDPYKLLLQDWMLPEDDIINEWYSDFRLNDKMIHKLQSKYSASFHEIQKYFEFRDSKWFAILKIHNKYLENLTKPHTDILVRYIRGDMMSIQHSKDRTCFTLSRKTPGSYDANDISRPKSFAFRSSKFMDSFKTEYPNIQTAKDVKTLVNIIHKSPQPKSTSVLFRGMKDPLLNVQVGDTISHASIMSTSNLLIGGLMWAQFAGTPGSLLVIEVDPSQVPMLCVGNAFTRVVTMSNQLEVILPPLFLHINRIEEKENVMQEFSEIERRAYDLYAFAPINGKMRIFYATPMLPKQTKYVDNCITIF